MKGVHVDDNKAMFLFRWYQEVDANDKVFTDGSGVPTYQNPGCKAYYLPLDNGGSPFEWVSNFQVITAVHLQPHTRPRTGPSPSQPRTRRRLWTPRERRDGRTDAGQCSTP